MVKYLSYNKLFDDNGLKYLSNGIDKLNKLTHAAFNFFKNKITKKGLKYFSEAITNLTNLRLSLGYNRIGYLGTFYL